LGHTPVYARANSGEIYPVPVFNSDVEQGIQKGFGEVMRL
jgi:hypothetical protein